MSKSVEGGATTEPLTLFLHSLRYPRAARPSLLPPAARIGALYFFCRVLAQRGEVVFKRAQACCSTAAIEPDPPLSRKRLSSTPQVLVLEAGLTTQTPSKRPAMCRPIYPFARAQVFV